MYIEIYQGQMVSVGAGPAFAAADARCLEDDAVRSAVLAALATGRTGRFGLDGAYKPF